MNELIYALMQTGMNLQAGRGRSLQDAKENEIVQGNQRRLKAALLRKVVSFPFDTSNLSGISGYWENNQPFQKSLWHPK